MLLDKKEQAKESDMVIERPLYPCGLNFTMNDDAIEKIGLTELPEVGTAFTMTATVTVTGVSANQYADGDKNRSVSLQITAMALDAPVDDEKGDAQDSLYSGKKK